MNLPALTTNQMVEVDRLMIEEFGISLVQMMENAGSGLASLAVQMLSAAVERPPKVVVICGGGNNGGGGMVAARHLHNRGVDVRAALAVSPGRLKEVPALQWAILQKIGIPRAEMADLQDADLILDALIGYGIRGDPQGAAAEWIRCVNESCVPVLSLDAPSGLDTTTGLSGEPCVRAAATLTLALPKVGLLADSARKFVGDLYLADISVPPELYHRLGIDVTPIFGKQTIVKV